MDDDWLQEMQHSEEGNLGWKELAMLWSSSWLVETRSKGKQGTRAAGRHPNWKGILWGIPDNPVDQGDNPFFVWWLEENADFTGSANEWVTREG